MPFIEDVEEAREKVSVVNTEIIGEEMDAENVQGNEEDNLIGAEVHPDHETHGPDFFFEGNLPPKKTISSFRKIELWDNKTIRTEIRKLDPDQRYVLDLFIYFAKCLRLAEKGFCAFPPPLWLVVEGDAGSGKSELIKNLCQVMEKEFRKAGDDPEQPYILKGSFTGEAASNIQGQTLTSLFNLSFGNKLGAMSDQLLHKKGST